MIEEEIEMLKSSIRLVDNNFTLAGYYGWELLGKQWSLLDNSFEMLTTKEVIKALNYIERLLDINKKLISFTNSIRDRSSIYFRDKTKLSFNRVFQYLTRFKRGVDYLKTEGVEYKSIHKPKTIVEEFNL